MSLWVVFIIVVMSILLIVVVTWVILRENYIRNANPIQTISYNGCMGFRIGDSYDMVASRMIHLRMAGENEVKEQTTYNNNKDDDDYIVLASLCRGVYNNVDSINFIFDKKKNLESILVKIWSEQEDISVVTNLITKIINSKLRAPKELRVDKYDNTITAYWEEQNRAIKIEKHPDQSFVFISCGK